MTTPPPPWRRAAGCLLLPALLAGLGLSGAAGAQTIATGARHGLALQADGSVLAWGDNRLAQLGQGKTVYASTAREIALPAKATAVRTSRTTALVLDQEGHVWSWGTNARGQLGDGTRADRATPQVVFRGAVYIANGGDAAPSFLIDKDGQPWWWGPLPSGRDAAVPERAAQLPARLVRIEHQLRATVALDEQGVVWSWGEGAACSGSGTAASAPTAMRGVPPIVDFIFEAQGPITNLGPDWPALGPVSRVTAKDAGGRLWVWGTDPHRIPDGLPSQGLTHCPAERWALAYDPFVGRDSIHPDMEKAGVKLQKVVHGGGGSLGWTAEGDLWRWQYVPTGEISGGPRMAVERVATGVVDASGHNTASRGVLPVLMYITRDGKVHAMGSNTSLHLAVAADAAGGAESIASPRKVSLPSAGVSVHASEAGSHALLADGRIFRWGLGAVQYDWQASYLGSSFVQTPTHIPLGAPVTQLAAAQGQWLAVDADGKVWSSGGWGIDPVPHSRPAVVGGSTGLPLARSVSVGGNGHGAILGVDGSVWTIGGSREIFPPFQGSDVHGSLVASSVPRKVEGLPSSITQVATADGSYGAAYALDASGTVWFWGAQHLYGISGQDSAGLNRGQWLVRTPIVLPLPHKAVSIHAGDFNVCAVLQDGSAQCYGKLFNEHRGRRLQLHAPIREISMGVDEDRADTVATARRGGTVHLRLADGTVWALGQGRQGQLGSGAYASAAEPIPVANEAGTGDLDLDPAAQNGVAANRPPFRVKTLLAGNLRSLSFTGDVFGSSGTPPGANVYALASAGPLGQGVWVQLDAQGTWSPLRWPVPAVASNVQLGSEAQAVPLNLRPQQLQQGSDLTGLRLYIGYGRDVDEMLAARRFREVLELGPDATGMVLTSDF
ncbi:Regulator of chromosome condensation (RCC1) repeat containing protein [Acidovorax sp. CF316]|uniref:RCC1 domain-containing protein n=1 Tax=Acidovorax sp. CF316 TaxID=1144317 RepID=UPI00026BD3B9|nr:Regulator of chromosome condensation (RCC1) repeat containing protein [Acidovorax sp. CF316]EJE51730.1 Regulator of chromosome condensation (RCC1) repeat containing protein [Acidovorax sp. CF316]